MQAKAEQVSSRIIKNVLMNWVSFLVTILSGFLMSPFMVRHLGDSVYGVWVLVGSMIGYLGLLDFGVTASIIKYVAEHRARGDREAINRVVTGGVAVYALMGVVTLAVSLAVAFHFNDIFHTPLSQRTAVAVVMLAGLNLALTFPASVFAGVLRGCQRFDIDARVTAITIVARSLVLVALILRGYGILAVALVVFVSDMARLAYVVRWAFKLNPNMKLARKYLDRAELRRLFGYSIFFFLIIIGRRMLFFTDEIVIGLFMTTASVTAYFVAARLVTYLRELILDTVGVLMPRISELDARNDQAGIKELLVAGTKYMMLIALPVATVFFVMGADFITLWMGPSFRSSATILTILTIAILAHFLEMPAQTLLFGLGKHRIVAQILLAQAVTNLALSVLLVRPFGLVGVALGTTIPMIVFTLAALVVYFRYYLKLSLGEYLYRSALLPIVIQVPFITSLLLLKAYNPPQSAVAFVTNIAVALAPYGALAFLLCTSPSERRAFMRFAERFRLRLAPRPS